MVSERGDWVYNNPKANGSASFYIIKGVVGCTGWREVITRVFRFTATGHCSHITRRGSCNFRNVITLWASTHWWALRSYGNAAETLPLLQRPVKMCFIFLAGQAVGHVEQGTQNTPDRATRPFILWSFKFQRLKVVEWRGGDGVFRWPESGGNASAKH